MRVLGIIGAGHVGSHIAYAAGLLHAADVIKICDINEEVVRSQVQDLNDATKYMLGKVRFEQATYAELGDCGVLINTAGKASMSAASRDDELIFTARLILSCIKKVQDSGFKGIFINVANPCDVITQLVVENGKLGKGRVFGTGTSLDSARLSSYLSTATGLEHNSFDAIVMGEHGDSQMIPWSHIQFMGQPLDAIEKQWGISLNREDVVEQVMNTARKIYKGKGCTEYGIGAVTASIAKSIFADEKKIFVLSVPLHGEYGESDVCAGVPVVIGKDGIEKVIELQLTEEEQKLFASSCKKIKDGITIAHQLMKA